jgi:uncharacterized protein (DUF58 family)
VAAVVLPFALLGAVVPGAMAVALLFVGGFFLLVVADAALASTGLKGIGVELPAVARMSKGREAKLEVRVRNEQRRKKNLRLALAWPPELRTEQAEVDAILPAETEWSRLVWACTPLQRGNFKVQAAFIEGGSPLGFWSARKTVPVRSEIRVYPNLMGERKNLAALFLNRGGYGIHAQRQVGKGRDFEKLREYVPGDGYDEIHWKATARRGRPVTKVFQIEKRRV